MTSTEIGFVDSTPPDIFTGSSPSSAVTPFSVIAELITEGYCVLATKKLVALVDRPTDSGC